ncbi:hypothetical protein HZS_7200 [Henneguya salminicola]|nr:hypothetical protein HZS_7200 [Henneguya salminicola]
MVLFGYTIPFKLPLQFISKECLIVPIEDRTEATLLPLICKWIKSGTIESPTIIISDKWKSYTKIDKDKREHEDRQKRETSAEEERIVIFWIRTFPNIYAIH